MGCKVRTAGNRLSFRNGGGLQCLAGVVAMLLGLWFIYLAKWVMIGKMNDRKPVKGPVPRVNGTRLRDGRTRSLPGFHRTDTLTMAGLTCFAASANSPSSTDTSSSTARADVGHARITTAENANVRHHPNGFMCAPT